MKIERAAGQIPGSNILPELKYYIDIFDLEHKTFSLGEFTKKNLNTVKICRQLALELAALIVDQGGL